MPFDSPAKASILGLHGRFDRPYDRFDDSILGAGYARELDVVSRLWLRCGYRPGIAVSLNFLLLGDFMTLHEEKYASRFPTFRAMMDAFCRIDAFVRQVTDSGAQRCGGIASPEVRRVLDGVRQRHARAAIPSWMQTYFGFSVIEMVEKHCAPLTEEEKGRHLAYMCKAYRIMGVPFTQDRNALERFARLIEEAHAAPTRDLAKHSRHVLRIAEMAGVSSGPDSILDMLPPRTRAIFAPLYPAVRPGPLAALLCRLSGRLLLPRAVGKARHRASRLPSPALEKVETSLS